MSPPKKKWEQNKVRSDISSRHWTREQGFYQTPESKKITTVVIITGNIHEPRFSAPLNGPVPQLLKFLFSEYEQYREVKKFIIRSNYLNDTVKLSGLIKLLLYNQLFTHRNSRSTRKGFL